MYIPSQIEYIKQITEMYGKKKIKTITIIEYLILALCIIIL